MTVGTSINGWLSQWNGEMKTSTFHWKQRIFPVCSTCVWLGKKKTQKKKKKLRNRIWDITKKLSAENGGTWKPAELCQKTALKCRKGKDFPRRFPRKVRHRNEWAACKCVSSLFTPTWWFKCASVCLEGEAMSSLKACKQAASRGESRLSGLMFSWKGLLVRLVEPEVLLGIFGVKQFLFIDSAWWFHTARPLCEQWLAAEPKVSCFWFCFLFFYCLFTHLEKETNKTQIKLQANIYTACWRSALTRMSTSRLTFSGSGVRLAVFQSCDSGGLNPLWVKGPYMVISIGAWLHTIFLEQTQHGDVFWLGSYMRRVKSAFIGSQAEIQVKLLHRVMRMQDLWQSWVPHDWLFKQKWMLL